MHVDNFSNCLLFSYQHIFFISVGIFPSIAFFQLPQFVDMFYYMVLIFLLLLFYEQIYTFFHLLLLTIIAFLNCRLQKQLSIIYVENLSQCAHPL